MIKGLLETQAIVLNKESSNENFIRLELFCPNNGKLTCLARCSSKNQKNKTTTVLPDLFDCITVQLSPAKQGSLLFLKDFRLDRRYAGVSKNYSAFHYACLWVKILSLNLTHIDRPESLFLLTQKALDFFESLPNPQAIYFKTLYLFTRQEGYPIKEDWLINLPSEIMNEALIILQSALKEQKLIAGNVEKLIDHLHSWLRHSTEILISN